MTLYPFNRIVIVNSRFLKLPQKRSRRNQLIPRRLTKRKSIGGGQDPESQAGRRSDGYGGWCLELRRGGGMRKTMNQDKICWRAFFSVWSERAVERWQWRDLSGSHTLNSLMDKNGGDNSLRSAIALETWLHLLLTSINCVVLHVLYDMASVVFQYFWLLRK